MRTIPPEQMTAYRGLRHIQDRYDNDLALINRQRDEAVQELDERHQAEVDAELRRLRALGVTVR